MEAATARIYEAGDVIFREGEAGDRMFVLLEGKVDLKVKVEKGEAVIKTVAEPNDFFGEMALIDAGTRSATAVAERRTKVLVVDGPSFEAMILSNPKFALKIIKVLSARLRSSNDKVSELIDLLPKERLARGMVDYALRQGERIHDGSFKVALEPMKAWINSHLGFSPEDMDALIARLLKGEAIAYAPTSAKTHQEVLLNEAFMRDHDRRA